MPKTEITASGRATLFCAAILATSSVLTTQAREITVPSGRIQTIQQAVNAAAPGDTILVLPGTYAPVSIGPDKPGLQLRGIGTPGSVKVVGFGDSFWNAGIYIEADNVTVQGFEVSEATSGIHAEGILKGIKITDNRIGDLPGPSSEAIDTPGSIGAEIARNTFFGTIDGNGIALYQCSSIHVHENKAGEASISGSFIVVTGSTGCELDHNNMAGGGSIGGGIFLNGWQPAGPNTQHYVHHNQMNSAAQQGIFVWQSPNCALDNNICDNNTQAGIAVQNSGGCILQHNEANNNGPDDWSVGLSIGGSPACTVSYNKADTNGWWGIIVAASCGSTFDHNSAEGNGWAAPEGHPIWDFYGDLFAPDWGSDPACNTYLDNHAGTAGPSLELWDVK